MQGDFQICISVPLIKLVLEKLSCYTKLMSETQQ